MLIPFLQPVARRVWFVPGLRVWGSPTTFQIHYLVAEHLDTPVIHYGTAQIGASSQSHTYAELIDSRGNHLPDEIDAPRIIVRPRSDRPAFIVGQEDDRSFKIARPADATDDTIVDLLILELGH